MMTDGLLPFYTFTSYILAGYGGFNLIFYAKWSIPTVLTTVAIVFSWFILRKTPKLLYSWLEHFYGKWKTKKLDKIRYEVLIGLGGIFVFCTVPRIIVFFFADNYYMIWYTVFVSLSAIQMFHDSFIQDHVGTWKVKRSLRVNLFSFLLLAHLISLIASIGIATYYYKKEEGSRTIVNFQIGYMFLCLICSFELLEVLSEDIYEVAKKKEENSENSPVPAVENILKVICPVCTKEYQSKSNAPRVLIECGHTICEKCADKQLEKGNKQHLFCPICKAVTVVNGPANLLPKNLGILEIIETVNKKYGTDKKQESKKALNTLLDSLINKQ